MKPRHRIYPGLLRFAVLCVSSAMSFTLAPAQVAVEYLGRLGFADSRHTAADGFQSSEVLGITPAGFTVGESQRFVGTPIPDTEPPTDVSTWIGSPWGGAKSIGLYDAIHTGSGGYHTNNIVKFNHRGHAIGHAVRFEGSERQLGQSAWVATWTGGTRLIGLYDERYRTLTGSFGNTVIDVNAAGQSIGFTSAIYSREAWLADAAGNTTLIGTRDPDQQSPHFQPHNTPVALNDSGTVIGIAQWSGGRAAWLQPKNGGQAVTIGIYDADHTYSDGTVDNRPVVLNARGLVAGRARNIYLDEDNTEPLYSIWVRRPNGETELLFGNGALDSTLILTDSNLLGADEHASVETRVWLFDLNTGVSHTLGLVFDTELYTSSNHLVGLTENGIVLGSAHWSRGSYAWMADRSGDLWRVGFDYNRGAPGAVSSGIVAYSAEGVAVGYSLGGYDQGYGQVAWIASPVTRQTYVIGLQDAVHRDLPNEQGVAGTHAMPTHVTRSKFVAGYNVRYHGDYEPEGQTAWIYNSPAGKYARLEFSVRASDGYAFSQVNQLLENGIAIGTYTKFADDGTDLGDRAFVWITKRGAYDLGSVLDVDPETVGWDYLASAIVANEAGYIAGLGVPYDSASQGVFLTRLSSRDE